MSISEVLELPSRLTLISSSDFGSTTLASETKLQSSYVIYSYLWKRCFEPFKFLRFYLIFFIDIDLNSREQSKKIVWQAMCDNAEESFCVSCKTIWFILWTFHAIWQISTLFHFTSWHSCDKQLFAKCSHLIPIIFINFTLGDKSKKYKI